MKKKRVLCCMLALLFGAAPAGHATDNATAVSAQNADKLVTTRHRIAAGKTSLKYTTTAGWLILKNENSRQRAKIFFVGYEKTGRGNHERPITFAFNGGPGSSSVWLHMGAMGPRRVVLRPDGSVPPVPVQLIDNEHTWLSFSDLVFIDPVGTGYSRAADEKREQEFFDFKGDIASVGDFIRLYLTRFNRWRSPVYLAGESYGTARAVGLIEYLHRQHGIALNGVVLISPVLDFNTISISPANDLPYLLFLPTYAAVARYHARTAGEPPSAQSLRQVERWAVTDFSAALAQGAMLGDAERMAVASQAGAYAGLEPEYVAKNSLRVRPERFRKELLREQGLVIGRMDARMAMPDTDAAADAASSDPSFDRLVGVFAGGVNAYIRDELRFTEDSPYAYLNHEANKAWNWKPGIGQPQGYVTLSQDLADAVHMHSHFKVFIAAGYYDLATPYFAAYYTVAHLPLDESRRNAVELHCYPAGHMPYTDLASLCRLTADAAAFYRSR